MAGIRSLKRFSLSLMADPRKRCGRGRMCKCYGSVKMILFSYSNKDIKNEEGELRREARLRPYTRHDASTLTLGTAPQQQGTEAGGSKSLYVLTLFSCA